jgi:hypothetical protein
LAFFLEILFGKDQWKGYVGRFLVTHFIYWFKGETPYNNRTNVLMIVRDLACVQLVHYLSEFIFLFGWWNGWSYVTNPFSVQDLEGDDMHDLIAIMPVKTEEGLENITVIVKDILRDHLGRTYVSVRAHSRDGKVITPFKRLTDDGYIFTAETIVLSDCLTEIISDYDAQSIDAERSSWFPFSQGIFNSLEVHRSR